MIKSVLTDFFQEALPADSRQRPEAGISVVDETFQKIFSSIQETNRQIENRADDSRADDKRADDSRADDKRADDSRADGKRADDSRADGNNLSKRESDTSIYYDETDEAPRNEDENQETGANVLNPEPGDDGLSDSDESAQPDGKAEAVEKPADDEKDNEELTEAKIKEKVLKLLNELLTGSSQIKNMDKNLASLEQAASMIAKRLFKLSESDPASFEKLMDNLSKISLKDRGINLEQAVSQMIKLIQTTGAQGEAAQNQDNRSLEALLKQALKPGEKTDQAPEDKRAALKDFSEKGEKRADGQPFDKALDAGKDKRVSVNAAQNKDASNQQAAAKQAISSEAVNSVKNQVNADLKPNTVKITNNIMAETNPAQNSSGKTASADQPQQVRAKFTSREVFERMLVDQIAKKARINVRANGVSNIVVQIDPPNLGKVNIRISVHDSAVRAYLIADNPEVRSIIENNLDTLKNSMNNQGLKVDQITVTTPDAFTRNRNETLGNDFGSERNRDNQDHAMGSDEAQDAEGELTTAQVRALAHDGVLNIVA